MNTAEILRAVDGDFAIALPRAMISQLGVDESEVERYEGSADVSLNEQGEVMLRFMCPSGVPFSRAMWATSTSAGEIIPLREFFKLEGLEPDGTRWVCPQLLPDFSTGVGGAVVTSKLATIEQLSPARGTNHLDRTAIFFSGKADFFQFPWASLPADAKRCVLDTSIADRGLYAEGAGWKMSLVRGPTWFSSHVEHATTLDATFFPDRIARALEIFLGRQLQPSVEVLASGGQVRTIVHSVGATNSSRSYPPVEHANPSTVANSLEFLRLVLEKISADRALDWPSLVIYLRQAMAALNAPLETMALVLSVATEGLVKSEFGNLQRDDLDALEASIKRAEALVTESSDLSDGFKARLRGAIGAFRQVRAGDVLKALEANGSLPPKSTDAWSRLRNSAAHPIRSSGAVEIDRLYMQCLGVLMVAYRLVFLSVGYRGPYVDYSTRGWPKKVGAGEDT